MPRDRRSTSFSASSSLLYGHMRVPPRAGPSTVLWIAMIAFRPASLLWQKTTCSWPKVSRGSKIITFSGIMGPRGWGGESPTKPAIVMEIREQAPHVHSKSAPTLAGSRATPPGRRRPWGRRWLRRAGRRPDAGARRAPAPVADRHGTGTLARLDRTGAGRLPQACARSGPARHAGQAPGHDG